MEIYNEKVRDLFNPDGDGGGLHGLKVRDNPQTGPYVEGLSRTILTSYKEFEHLLNEGNAVRTVAATQMNATSSRAHTVFQIVFTTTTHDEETNKSSAKTSKINLVDCQSCGGDEYSEALLATTERTGGYELDQPEL